MKTDKSNPAYPLPDMPDTSDYEECLLTDDALLAALLADCAEDPAEPPAGFGEAVMANLPPRLAAMPRKSQKPGSEERLWAAFCFSAAAAVLLLGFFGVGDAVTDMLTGASGKLGELLAIVTIK